MKEMVTFRDMIKSWMVRGELEGLPKMNKEFQAQREGPASGLDANHDLPRKFAARMQPRIPLSIKPAPPGQRSSLRRSPSAAMPRPDRPNMIAWIRTERSDGRR
jgi:hypothetical protein